MRKNKNKPTNPAALTLLALFASILLGACVNTIPGYNAEEEEATRGTSSKDSTGSVTVNTDTTGWNDTVVITFGF